MNKLTNKGNYAFLIFACALMLAGSATAQIFTGSAFTIADGLARVPASCSTVPVSGIVGSRNIRSISLNSATHTWIGDLEIRVYPPSAAPPPSTAGSTVISSPPTGRGCNLSGTYTFIDTAAQSIDAATTGCASATNLAPGSYRSSTYGGGTNPGPVTSLATSFGPLTAAQANGNWLVCAFDFGTPDGGTVGSTSIQFVAPSAGDVSVGGRVMTASGRGISKSTVTLRDLNGEVLQTALTSSFGYYSFDELTAGQTYTISVSAKGYRFDSPTIIHTVGDAVDNLDFTANEGSDSGSKY